MKLLLLVLLCSMLLVGTTAWGQSNPYGVAGTGVLTKLGMPAGCSEYVWDNLVPSIPIQMVGRPCKYWISVGGTHQFWGYHESTDTIDNPTQFAAWVTANPGKTWIVGNEPDNGGQDGLSADQYAQMYHTYYAFIIALDPTAKFAIGASVGGSDAAGFTYTQGWYNSVLNSYKTKFGTRMPIDVWNVHSYSGGARVTDPDKIINEFVNPFVNYCHTVDSAAYASCPVWITECELGEWMGALSVDNTIAFMQQFLPRLEQTGVSKWFWYVSVDWDGRQGSCALTNQSGAVTAVGQAYAALANGYPNTVPAIVPFVPDPTPDTFFCDFSSPIAAPWFVKGGWWGASGGELRHTGIYPFPGTTCALSYIYGNTSVAFRMKINSAAADINWGGVLLRTSSRWNDHAGGGYLVYVRKNGELSIYDVVDGVVASVPGAIADTSAYHNLQASIEGYTIRVSVDGVQKLAWTDPNSRYSSGYTIPQVYKADVSFDDFGAITGGLFTPAVTDDGDYTEDLTHIHAAWTTGAGLLTGYDYCVGTSAGASDVLGWTHTSAGSAAPSISLTPGTTYYVSVRATYPAGVYGPVASSNGIKAVRTAESIRDLKSLPAPTFAILRGKIVSAVYADCIYIQEPDRQHGIRVAGSLGVIEGDVLTLMGNLQLNGKEAQIQSAQILEKAHIDAPEPVLMNNNALGGAIDGIQPASIDKASTARTAVGANTSGLLVRTTGNVTYVDPAGVYVYIDDGSNLQDGSGHAGVKCLLSGATLPELGSAAAVTGACSAFDVSGNCARLIKTRSAGDIYFARIQNLLANPGFETGSFAPWTTIGSGAGVQINGWRSINANTGTRFVGVFTSKAIYNGTVLQTVSVPADTYCASVWSAIQHPFTSDPEITKNRIGVDPTGGTNPDAGTVVWSNWDTTTGTTLTPWHQIMTPYVTSAGGPITVFLQYWEFDATKNHINCFDDARLIPLQ